MYYQDLVKISCHFESISSTAFWITVGQGPTSLAVGAGGGCLDIFNLTYPLFPLPPSRWETVRYRLKYCLKGPLNPKQPTNQSSAFNFIGTFAL